MQSAGLSTDQAYAFGNQLLNQQAFTMAALDVFDVSAVLLVLLIPVIWLAHRPAAHSAPADAAARTRSYESRSSPRTRLGMTAVYFAADASMLRSSLACLLCTFARTRMSAVLVSLP